jgi:hypothetical protein
MEVADPDVLRDLLDMARKFVTAHEARRSPSRNRRNLPDPALKQAKAEHSELE